jgi:thioredoxin reductase
MAGMLPIISDVVGYPGTAKQRERLMEKRIGIIGAGVAGLHLGLYLRQHETSATIITDRTAEQIARGACPTLRPISR